MNIATRTPVVVFAISVVAGLRNGLAQTRSAPRPMSLNDAMRLALDKNPDLATARPRLGRLTAARRRPEHGKLHAPQGGMSRTGTTQQVCILAIDDEEGFLGLLKAALECQGYRVHTASGAREAIKVYEERWRDIGMVFLDYLLPQMSGDLVFDELQRLNPDVRVVLLTGCEESVADPMFEKGLRGYLQKPFSLPDLAQKVRDAIEAPALDSSTSPLPV